jgi:hypothetical protein
VSLWLPVADSQESHTGLTSISPLRLLSPRPSLLTPTGDPRATASPQKPLDLKQLKQRAAAIPPIVSGAGLSAAP